MRVLDAAAVHAALPWPWLIEALRAAHHQPMPMSDVVVQNDPTGLANLFVTLPSWAPDGPIVVKMVGVFRGNADLSPPQPAVQGLVALFDGKTGAPLLVADGAAMTARKTAADSALGAAILAREDAETLLVVGAGALSPHVAAAHCAARPSIRRVAIWNRSPLKAVAVADELRGQGIAAEACVDLEAEVARAELQRRGQFNVIDLSTSWKADLIFIKDRPFSRTELERRAPVTLLGVSLFVATAEDTILAKLEWAKLGASERQLEDVRGIIEAQADALDRAYSAGWLDALGVRELWDWVIIG